MKLELVKTIASPDSGQNQAIWISENETAFYITDTWKVVKIGATDFNVTTITETSDHEVAYQMKGIYDKRLADSLFEEIRNEGMFGFKLLTKAEYDNIDVAAGSTSYLEMVNRFDPIGRDLPMLGHNDQIFTFGSKSISMGKIEKNALEIVSTIKTKGKIPVAVSLHPTQNMIVYATNYGEIYGQYVDSEGFGKTVKIDNIQKPSYQAAFTSDGKYLIICGIGYVKLYGFIDTIFTELAMVQGSARSFEIIENHLILNKGMNGIDLFRIGDKLEKLNSIDIPFAIDRMICHKKQRLVLLTGNPHGKIGFVKFSA